MNSIYRNTYSEINLKNIYKNYLSVKKCINTKNIIPVVKANAYGHGVIDVVRYLLSKNIDYYAVSTLEEAIELRKEFDKIDILVMGIVQRKYFEIAAKSNFVITISNFDQIADLALLKTTLKVHLKVDSGMNRLGFKKDKDILNIFDILSSNSMIIIEGIYTHFSTADNNYDYYKYQLRRFEQVLKMIPYNFDMVHASNSSSSIKYEQEIPFTTHVRLGISLYGLTLDSDTKFLENTYKLITHVSEIKHLDIGDKVGYGATYTAKQKEIIGVLPIGYADGFIRKNRDGDVEINGKRYQIIGTICMDQMFIKIDDNISKKDDVILFGGLISIDEVATRLDTINYEIICQITYRVPKIYSK
ncbi:MAG: Alanine racemase [Candidatus Izimaplasma bacterium HR2]|nr:MAG: Alanine racemase [Candidatus Izimaplasma bacterium HR2]